MPQQESLSDVFVQTLEQVIDAVVVINSNNDIILFNKAAEKMWGYSRQEVLGHNVNILVPASIKHHHDDYVNANRQTGVNKIVGSNRDIEFTRKDGSTCWGSMSISKVEVEGKVLYTAVIKDVEEMVLQRKRLELLSMVTNNTDEAVFMTDQNWHVVYVNQGFEKKLGFLEGELLGKDASQMLPMDLDENTISKIQPGILAGSSVKIEQMLQTKLGKRLWVTLTANPVYDEQGQLQNVVVIMSEITQTKLHEVIHTKILEKIARGEALEIVMESICVEMRQVTKELHPAIFSISPNNTLQLLAATGITPEIRKAIQEVEIKDGNGCSATAAFRGKIISASEKNSDELWEGIESTVKPLHIRRCSAFPLKSSDGKVLGVLSLANENPLPDNELLHVLVDIICPLCSLALEREEQKQNIRKLAFFDSLTSLPNRSLFLAKSEQALNAAKRSHTPMAILFIDLDKFKQINDAFGHAAGDKVLLSVAERLEDACAKSHICGRLSGDEFVASVSGLNIGMLSHFIEELKTHLSQPIDIVGAQLIVKTSIGVSLFPNDGHDVETLLRRADLAMYQAKQGGQGRFTFYSHEFNQFAQEKQELENALRHSIETQKLRLAYQPQINLDSGTLYGVEALCRWFHPQFGEISPARFIPLAEESGLIHDLSRWVLKEACRQLAEWRAAGVSVPCVSINLSPLSFHDSELKNRILCQLNNYQLNTSDLTIELTEGVLLDANPGTLDLLEEIHQAGIGLAIDDFGTGYASLSYLQKIPIKELKLDRSFVTDISKDKTSRTLSEATILIGSTLELDVVAEGIEDAEQLAILRQQGYHVGQGYYFSKPLLPKALEEWLTQFEWSPQ